MADRLHRVRWVFLAAAVVLLVVFLLAQRQNGAGISYAQSPSTKDTVTEGDAGELTHTTLPSTPELTERLRTEPVVRLPGATAHWDEKRVEAAKGGADLPLLVAPPGLTKEQQEQLEGIDRAHVTVIGTSVSGTVHDVTSGDLRGLAQRIHHRRHHQPAADDHRRRTRPAEAARRRPDHVPRADRGRTGGGHRGPRARQAVPRQGRHPHRHPAQRTRRLPRRGPGRRRVPAAGVRQAGSRLRARACRASPRRAGDRHVRQLDRLQRAVCRPVRRRRRGQLLRAAGRSAQHLRLPAGQRAERLPEQGHRRPLRGPVRPAAAVPASTRCGSRCPRCPGFSPRACWSSWSCPCVRRSAGARHDRCPRASPG